MVVAREDRSEVPACLDNAAIPAPRGEHTCE